MLLAMDSLLCVTPKQRQRAELKAKTPATKPIFLVLLLMQDQRQLYPLSHHWILMYSHAADHSAAAAAAAANASTSDHNKKATHHNL